MARSALLLLALLPATVAKVEVAQAKSALQKLNAIKSLDLEDVECDECLEEIDCIWPCEIACVLSYPDGLAEPLCSTCLDYFGCEGCSFMCPTPATPSPTTPGPTTAPTYSPTSEPTGAPTAAPTNKPTPTHEPTAVPVPVPTAAPVPAPTAVPVPAPTAEPVSAPTAEPTAVPVPAPTAAPVPAPTTEPTAVPVPAPTSAPVHTPTAAPVTAAPSAAPVHKPTAAPITIAPTLVPVPVPTAEPTSVPIPVPTSVPTPVPTSVPIPVPTSLPTPVPSAAPSTPSPSAEPTYSPTIAPELLYYYTSYDTDLYSYNPVSKKEEYIFSSQFDGDFKIDSINKAFFWSSGNLGHITKFNLTSGEKTIIVENTYDVMGLALDSTNQELYFCDQDDHSIVKVSYYGGEHTVIHDLIDDDLQPYGIDVDEENDIMYFSAADDYYGYIFSSNLAGTDGKTQHYQSDSKAVYGVVIQKGESLVWWLEKKGVANGIYSAREDSFDDYTFVKYLEESYWMAAMWDDAKILVGDYSAGVMYTIDVDYEDDDANTVTVDHTEAIAYLAEVRGVGYYFRATENAPAGPSADSVLAAAAPKKLQNAAAGRAKKETLIEEEEEAAGSKSSGAAFPTSTVFSAGALVAAVVGAVMVSRKRSNVAYSRIGQADFEI